MLSWFGQKIRTELLQYKKIRQSLDLLRKGEAETERQQVDQ